MRRKNDVSIKDALEEMVSELKLKPRLNEWRIKDNWRKLMGEMIANRTTGISLRGGKLYLKVDSAALKNELTYSREKIIQIFNDELGEKAIKEVLIY